MAALVEFAEVRCHISGRDILCGVDLSVDRGEALVLLGRSGSGKTTLLKMVNRLLTPSGGEVRFDGKNVSGLDPIRLRRSIGYVIQDGGLFPHATVEENVGLVPKLEGWKPERIRNRVEELLVAMGLAPATYARRHPGQLSGGEKQRVGIARALAADPDLMLLDEPFSALDPVTRFEMQELFVRLRETSGKTTIFVTHDIREALLIGSRIAVMHQGRIETVAQADDFEATTTPEATAFLATLGKDRKPHAKH